MPPWARFFGVPVAYCLGPCMRVRVWLDCWRRIYSLIMFMICILVAGVCICRAYRLLQRVRLLVPCDARCVSIVKMACSGTICCAILFAVFLAEASGPLCIQYTSNACVVIYNTYHVVTIVHHTRVLLVAEYTVSRPCHYTG